MAMQTLTAFYDSREYANNAALMLRQAGVTDVTVSPENLGTYDAPKDKGFWASLENMFGTEDRDTYSEGLRRGNVMLTAHMDDAKVDDAINIMEQHGSMDLDEHTENWRSEGWTGASATTAGALGVESTSLGVGSVGMKGAQTTTTSTAPVGLTAAPLATKPVSTAPVAGARDGVIQVVEEELSVGKRAISRGKVRVHAYVVETPVTESVSLRDETVTIDRRPVDRPLGVAEVGVDAFQDRTIELEEIDEEAVVAKTARVVEEIGIRKDATDRVQTVTDTVRSTKVDIDDGRKVVPGAALAGRFDTQTLDNLEVVGSDGQHVGVVDHMDNGGMVKLKKMDSAAGGQHHLIPTDWIASVDNKVMLKVSAAEAKSRWTAAG